MKPWITKLLDVLKIKVAEQPKPAKHTPRAPTYSELELERAEAEGMLPTLAE